MDAKKIAAIQELSRRGDLPPEKAAAYKELLTRGEFTDDGFKEAPKYIDQPDRTPTGAISTITGKPITEMTGNVSYEPASFSTLAKAAFVDNNDSKIKLFSDARGIDPSRYEVKNGRIWFKSDDGNMYPETPREFDSLIKKMLAELPADSLPDIGAGVGAFGGPGTAVAGAGIGELIRKFIGRQVFGDEQSIGDYGLDAATQMLFAGLDSGLAKKLTNWLSTSKIKRATSGKVKGQLVNDIGEISDLQRLSGMEMRQKGEKINVDLLPHQAMDDPALTGYYSMLRDNPKTARQVRVADDKLEQQVDKAGRDLVLEISPNETDPYEVGARLSDAGAKVIEKMKAARSKASGPFYKTAYASGANVDVKPVIEQIQDFKKQLNPKMKAYRALDNVESLLQREIDVVPAKKFTLDGNDAGPSLDELADYNNIANSAESNALDSIAKQYKREDDSLYRQALRDADEMVSSSGVFRDFDDAVAEGGLNYDTAVAMSDKNTVNQLRRRRPGLFKKGAALHSDHFANSKGFDTPDELFQYWLTADNKRDQIEKVANDIYSQYADGIDHERALEHASRLYNEEIKGIASQTKKRRVGAKKQKKLIPESRIETLDEAKQEIDYMLNRDDADALSAKMKRRLARIKDSLTTQTDAVSPDYQKARRIHALASPEIEEVESGVIGTLAGMKKENVKETAVNKIFASPRSVRVAKRRIQAEDPELWQDTVAEYFRSSFDKAAGVAQGSGGKVLNRPGKYVSKVWDLPDSDTLKKIRLATDGMKDANGEPLFDRINDFFEVMKKASIGQGKESATQSRLEMRRELTGLAGKGREAISSVGNLWNSAVDMFLGNSEKAAFDRNAKRLLDLMQTQEGVELIAKAKGLDGKKESQINAITTLLMMATETNADKAYGAFTAPEKKSQAEEAQSQ